MFQPEVLVFVLFDVILKASASMSSMDAMMRAGPGDESSSVASMNKVIKGDCQGLPMDVMSQCQFFAACNIWVPSMKALLLNVSDVWGEEKDLETCHDKLNSSSGRCSLIYGLYWDIIIISDHYILFVIQYVFISISFYFDKTCNMIFI